MKKIIFLCFAFILMHFFSSATNIPGGNVSGTWTLGGSPYLIQGAIMIPDGSTLTIEPGVDVIFQGSYKLMVLGRILAIGSVSDSITITAADTTVGWLGVQFDNTPLSNDSSKFYYCNLQYSKSTIGGGAISTVNFPKIIISNCSISHCRADAYPGGGAIHCAGGKIIITHCYIADNYSAYSGGGICCENSNPSILYNTFSNNVASAVGGAIVCLGIYNSSNATISNNIIINNSAHFGGGIYCANNSPKITANFISNNSASDGGGFYCSSGGLPTVSNNSISNNTALGGGGGIYCDYTYEIPTFSNNTVSSNKATRGGGLYCSLGSSVIQYNTIFWGNTADSSGHQVFLEDENSDPDFYYCDIQGSTDSFGLNTGIFYTGIYQNNSDTLPLFVAASAGSGTLYNGITANWSLQASSPCINAGTPDTTGLLIPVTDIAGNPRIEGGRIDVGAYELGWLSVHEVQNNFLIDIYPNPASDFLIIETPKKSSIEIFDIQGQLIKAIENDGIKTTIDVKNFSNGIYCIKAKTDGSVSIAKFIKE
ncbi:MAG: right-handed parallel beta-helix repeat-containing protein [Bacteroidota bacterium]